MNKLESETLLVPKLDQLIEEFKNQKRTRSKAFLGWFLDSIWRVAKEDIDDAICDSPNDGGIDAIYCDSDSETIYFFQSRVRESQGKTVGDSAIRDFAGALSSFGDADTTREYLRQLNNAELNRIDNQSGIIDKLSAGWQKKGVFVTNVEVAQTALAFAESTDIDIEIYGSNRICAGFIPSDRNEQPDREISLPLHGADLLTDYYEGNSKVVCAFIRASELLNMEGIENQELFAENLRGALGRTKVNKSISESIRSSTNHNFFPLFHNGLVLTCEKITSDEDRLLIKNYNVVNGCQSLTTLYQNRKHVTENLRLLVKLIETNGNRLLTQKITAFSNNQNGVKARDFKSNASTQVRLQNEINSLYHGKYFYHIKEGESGNGRIEIHNSLAGQLLLSFDCDECHSAHQVYKVFDSLYEDAFNRHVVNGTRIVLLFELMSLIKSALDKLENEALRKYSLTKFYVLYCLKRVLELEPAGRGLIQTLAPIDDNHLTFRRVLSACKPLVDEIMVEVNYQFREEDGKYPDHKTVLKSKQWTQNSADEVCKSIQKDRDRGKSATFESLFKHKN